MSKECVLEKRWIRYYFKTGDRHYQENNLANWEAGEIYQNRETLGDIGKIERSLINTVYTIVWWTVKWIVFFPWRYNTKRIQIVRKSFLPCVTELASELVLKARPGPWVRTLKNLDPEKIEPWRIWTQQNLYL